MVYLYYIIGALLESIKSPCVSRTFSLKDLLLTGFRGVFRRLLGSDTCKLERERLARCSGLVVRGAELVKRGVELSERTAIDKDALTKIVTE